MRPKFWVEDGCGGVRPSDMLEASGLLGSSTSEVGKDTVGEYLISTMFLVIDHQFERCPNAAPLLYETMVFGPNGAIECDRYHTRAEAAEGHRAFVKRYTEREQANSSASPQS